MTEPQLLSRAALVNIGAPKARFEIHHGEPFTLNFTSRGQTPEHTLVSLRNGGGKSSLINLLFSLLIPNARKFVGSTERGTPSTLSDYVDGDDTAHVVIEWVRPGRDEPVASKLITGLVMQWRSQRNTGRLTDLKRQYYLFTTDDTRQITFDTLPFHDQDGRRLRQDTFLAALADYNDDDADLGLVTTDRQNEWEKLLADHGVDPVLFDIQADMNAREGGAGVLLKKWRSVDELIDFLIDQTIPGDRLGEVNAAMVDNADKIRRRGLVRCERLFISEVLPHLQQLEQAHESLQVTSRTMRKAAFGAGRLARQFDLAADLSGERATRLRTRSDQLKAEAAEIAEAINAREGRARQYAHAAAKLTVDHLDEHHRQLEGRVRQAELERDAWRIVVDLQSQRGLEQTVTDLERRQRTVETDAEPLRRLRDTTHAALRRALLDAAQRHHGRVTGLRNTIATLNLRSNTLQGQATEARSRAGRAHTEAATARERLGKLTTERQRLVASDVLDEQENPAHAVVRHRRQVEATDARLEELDRSIVTLTKRLRTLDEHERTLSDTVEGHLREAQHLGRELDEARLAYTRLKAEPVVKDVLEGDDDVDLARAGRRIVAAVNDLADERDRRRQALNRQQDAVAAELNALRSGSPVAAPEYVNQARSVLADDGIDAHLGYTALHAQLAEPAARADVIDRNPAAAAGLVVADGRLLERARQLLDGMQVPGALVVSTAECLLAGEGQDPAASFTVAVTAPLVDPDAMGVRQQQLESELRDIEEQESSLKVRIDEATGVANQLADLLDRWPADRLDNHAARAATVDQAAATDTAQLVAAQRDKDHVSAELSALNDERRSVERVGGTSQTRLELAEQAVRIEDGDVDTLPARIAQLEREEAESARTEADHEREWQGLQERLAGLQGDLETAIRDEFRWGDRAEKLDEVAVEPSAVADMLAEQPDPDALEERLVRLTEQYEGRVTDTDLHRQLQESRGRLARVRGELSTCRLEVLAVAERLLNDPRAKDRDSRRHACDEADRQLLELSNALAITETSLKEAWKVLDEAAAIADGRLPDGMPSTLDEAVDLQHAAEREAEDARTRHQQICSEAEDILRQAEELDLRAERLAGYGKQLRSHLTTLGHETDLDDSAVARLTPFAGGTGDAEEQVDSTVKVLQELADKRQQHQAGRKEAADNTRTVAGRETFAELTGVRKRLASLNDEEMAEAVAARRWVVSLKETAAALSHELEQIERTEQQVSQALADEVDGAVRMLRACERASEMPDDPTLGPIAGKPFLKLSLKAMTGERLEGAVLQAIREAVEEALEPSGLQLLKYAIVRTTHDRRAEIFCPDGTLTDERYPVGNFKFSNGQALTGAVLLYCTVAKVRNRQLHSAKVGGPLILDNPIGEANNLTLLELQRMMAEQLGVQLVYMSGILQRDVFEAFGAVNRLANDLVDRSRGTSLVTVQKSGQGPVVAAHVFQGGPGPRGLTASRSRLS